MVPCSTGGEEVCIPTQHLEHIQPRNLKEIIKFQPRFQTHWAPRAPKSLHLLLEVPCIHSLFQGDLQQTSYTAQISGYFWKFGCKTLIAGHCPHDCWSSAELNPWTSQKLLLSLISTVAALHHWLHVSCSQCQIWHFGGIYFKCHCFLCINVCSSQTLYSSLQDMMSLVTAQIKQSWKHCLNL